MTRPLVLAILILAPPALAAAYVPRPAAPALLFNPSPSEPPGFYVRTDAAPAVGRRIAFRTPGPGRAYAARHMPELVRGSILKTIAAGPGEHVCAGPRVLSINGAPRAAIVHRDRLGEPLPQWRECRRLGPDEYFVLSTRVPNSFDSRYYGPVRRDEVLAVYRPAGRLEEASGGEAPS